MYTENNSTDYINLNQELGELLKRFRVRNEKSGKVICSQIHKTPSFLSKIENGMTKKITYYILTRICNTISSSQDGITDFIMFAFTEASNYSEETIRTLRYIDDVLYRFEPPTELTNYITCYMQENSITLEQIINDLNMNHNIYYPPNRPYDDMQKHMLQRSYEMGYYGVIELDYSLNSLSNILYHSSDTNYITLETILYSIFKLCDNSPLNAYVKATDILNNRFNIISIRKKTQHSANATRTLQNETSSLDPHVEDDYNNVINGIRLALQLSQYKGGASRIKALKNNLTANLGFTFSFISTDLEKLLPLSREQKQAFLDDLDNLIEKYSTPSNDEDDFYFGD